MTRADVVGGDDVADADLAGIEVDLDASRRGRPTERRVGVAAVRRVIEPDTRVRLELLVDPGRAVGPGVVPVRVGERAAGRGLDLCPQRAPRP